MCVRQLALQPGYVVLVDGLTVAHELNGAIGTCEEWLPERGRWRVSLRMSENLEPWHLRCLDHDGQVEPGAAVQVDGGGLEGLLGPGCGLSPDLVGAEGYCERWIVYMKLMRVNLAISRSIKPENLHLVSQDVTPKLAATMLTEDGADRDAQPAGGVDAALGTAFSTRGSPSFMGPVADDGSAVAHAISEDVAATVMRDPLSAVGSSSGSAPWEPQDDLGGGSSVEGEEEAGDFGGGGIEEGLPGGSHSVLEGVRHCTRQPWRACSALAWLSGGA